MTAWPRISIGSIVKIIGGGTPTRTNSDYYGGDIPWVTPKDMKTWDIRGAQMTLTELGLNNSSAKLAPANSVLIVVRSGVLKHTVPVGINKVPVAINQDMKALICSGEIIPAYLARFIKERSGEILKWVRATTADNFPIEKLKDLKVPLPPTDEQRRITEVLDRADELRVKRRQAIALLDDLAQSVFFDMIDSEEEPKASCRLGEIAEVVSGITKGRQVTDGVAVRAVPYLAVANVQDKRLELSSVKTIEATATEIERYQLRNDDLLLTEGGDPDKLGRGTLWGNELPEAIHQNHIFRVRLRYGVDVDPIYLNWYVASKYGRRYFLRSAKQTTGIASINATQLRNFPLHVPSLHIQELFVARIAGVRETQAVHLAHLAKLDELFESLQARAFSGSCDRLAASVRTGGQWRLS